MKDKNIIFIVSQPRSGSTYLQSLLSNNEEVNTSSEFWVQLNLSHLDRPDLVKSQFDIKSAVDALRGYSEKFNIDLNELRNNFLSACYRPLFEGYDYVVDKTPRYYEILRLIHETYPNSKIIILKRDPADVLRSMVNTWGVKSIRELVYLRRDLILAPKLMQQFLEKYRGNPNIHEVKYEELLVEPEKVTRRLYEWIGLTYSDSVLKTELNEKIKGKYGDPYQNKTKIKSEIIEKKMNGIKWLSPLTKGYLNYLGKEFLMEYGSYKYNEKLLSKTRHFEYFRHVRNELPSEYNLSNEIKHILKEIYYRILT